MRINQDALSFINNTILRDASNLPYRVASVAPSTYGDLVSCPSLVIWDGASDKTVFQSEAVNWAFRAIHDALHLETGLTFDPMHEIELGLIQASRQSSDLMRELIYCEIVMGAVEYIKTNDFILDQQGYTCNHLKSLGFKIF